LKESASERRCLGFSFVPEGVDEKKWWNVHCPPEVKKIAAFQKNRHEEHLGGEKRGVGSLAANSWRGRLKLGERQRKRMTKFVPHRS